MVTDSTSQSDATTAFLRAARSGNLEKVIEYLDTDLDINTANSNGLNALHLASKDGHLEIVTELMKRGAKVDAATKKGNTALHIASLAGQSEVVTILIQYGAAVNIQSQNGFTPLYMAAQENHDQVVKILLSNGANQSLATEDGFTPLAVAMQQGHDKVVSVLLENDSKGKVRLPALHIAAKKDDCKAADLLLQNDHKPDVTSKSGFTPLHIAAHYGNEDIARLLIKRGADVNYLAKHNISPLHVAAKWGKNNMVKILLENGASIEAKTRDGLTPLHCAARSGHEQCVTTLLENAAPISARTKNGLAPLHMASQGDHIDAARVLLYHRAPVDEVTIDYLTSLHVAAHCGHVRVAKLLLDRKADPNARALNGFTPLHIACKKNRIKVVELLLKHGASIESTTESGLTPLHVASFMGCMNIVIFLLQHEANPDVPTVRGETPLHLAARANQTDIIRILLRNGAKVDARAREQQTPLHIASRLGNVDIVMLLLQHGAAVDNTTKDMYTALHIAAKEGQEEVAAILVDNNASVKVTTKNGFTPLHVAAKYGNMNVAKILLQKDSKLDAQGKNDITPVLLACHYDHSNVAQLLLEKGASPHLASQNGQTPLHIAARKNQMDIATTLLEHGAKANVESKAGFTPLHLSSQKGHYDMTNLLIEHGADPNHKAKNGLTALHLCAQEDFIRVASILVKNGANVESETETGYRPIHVAAHFGNLSMIRFLLKHNAEIDVNTKQNYTPLHQAAQQGHAHVVSALIEGNASHRARTNDGLTALNIAQKLGYISVMEVLKGLPYDGVTPDNKNWEEKYKVIAPESLQETSLMSDSDDEGGSDALISEQPYRYLTADLMKSLRDDSLPIDVTRDDPLHKQISKEEHQQFVQSNNYCAAENFDSNDYARFLVSFLVDARGGTMKGCRHSGIRLIVPPRRAAQPIRVTCRLVKPSKMPNPPPLMEGESLATRVVEMGPVGATFLGPVLIDIPHFASVRDNEREIIILRSENGETWKEHDNSVDNDDTLLNTPYDSHMSTIHAGRITRIITSEFPQYFAIVTRIKQEVHVIGVEGGILISSVAPEVQAVFPPGALTKKIKVGLQAHVIPTELTAKLLGNCVAVSPVITIEPRRRKFHKPISLTLPVPQAANKGMINQYGGETPTLRLLCSIAGGTSEAQWEDVTGSTPLNFMNDKVSFTTTVSARFWLMDCRNIQEVPKMATDLYRESLYVPFITNFVIYSKRMEEVEATLRVLCMTDSKEGIHTLEKQEEFAEIVKSRDVETLDGKDLYIEFSGNLIPVTKSGVQLKLNFKSFRQNRLSFFVKVKDPQLDPVARMMFMREPKVPKGEPAQQPICVLNIVLPEVMDYKPPEDSNIISQKIELLKSSYKFDYYEEKRDQPKRTSPSEKKFITDTLQKEQKGESSPGLEKKTYTEKRRFWEDQARSKRESFQRSESEVSHTSQLTYHDSDSECLSDVREEGERVDPSETTVAEKAHFFEEQIQRETSAARPGSLKSQSSSESSRVAAARLSGISMSSEDDRSFEVFEQTEKISEEMVMEKKGTLKKVEAKTKEEKKDSETEKSEKKKGKEEKEVFTKVGVKTAKHEKRSEKGDATKEEKKKSKDEKDLVAGKKEPIKEEKKDDKKKSKDGKDLLLKKPDLKDSKNEKELSEIESEVKEIKSLIEKKDTKKKSEQKQVESTTKSKLETDLVTKETIDKSDKKITDDKVDSKIKPPSKIESEKESKAKATKMQENVSKQQKAAESRSSVTPTIPSKTKEETLPKPIPGRQKSKEESTLKSPPKKEKPKEDLISKSPPLSKSPSSSKSSSLSKSPPKKEKPKEDKLSKSPPISKSPPKKDKPKDDPLTKLSPKSEKPKVITPAKTLTKVEKEKDVFPEKAPIGKEQKAEPIKSVISQKGDSMEVLAKSPPKSEKLKVEAVSPLKKEEKSAISKTSIKADEKTQKSKTASQSEDITKKDIHVSTPLITQKVEDTVSTITTQKREESKSFVQQELLPTEKITAIESKTTKDVSKTSTTKEDKSVDPTPQKSKESKDTLKAQDKVTASGPSTATVLLKDDKKVEPAPLKPKNVSSIEKITAIESTTTKDVSKTPTTKEDKSVDPTPQKSKESKDILTDQNKVATSKPSTVPVLLKDDKKVEPASLKSDELTNVSTSLTSKDKVATSTPAVEEVAKLSKDEKADPLKTQELKDTLPSSTSKDEPAISKPTITRAADSANDKKVETVPPKSKEPTGVATSIKIEDKITSKPSTADVSVLSKGTKSEKIPSKPEETKEVLKSEIEIVSSAVATLITDEKREVELAPKNEITTTKLSTAQVSVSSKIILSEKESSRIAAARISGISLSSEDDVSLEDFEETERIIQEMELMKKKAGEIPKSMIPVREKSKEEFTVKSQTTGPKREKSSGEIPKSMIPKREKSKEEFSVKSPPKDDKTVTAVPKGEKSIGEIPKATIPKREKSTEEFSVKPPKDENKKEPLTTAPKREKSIGEIPKSMIPKREKSKEEFSIKSPPPEKTTSAPKREKSIGEIPKSMIPKREKSKEEFSIRSPSKDDQTKSPGSVEPKREKSIGEIPKSMIPQREKSSGEIPKSMIPVREKSKDEFTIKPPHKEDKMKEVTSAAPTREKSFGEIPKSMIPRREKSKEEFSIKSPPQDTTPKEFSPVGPKREKSIDEIPKSMIPVREKSKEEFTIPSSPKEIPPFIRDCTLRPKPVLPEEEQKSPPKDETTKTLPKREKSSGEIPQSMLPVREKSLGEISKIPVREKSKEEFSVSLPKDSRVLPSAAVKREKSSGEIPKSMIPRREKSKDEIPKSAIPKREKSRDEIPKTVIPKREKSTEEFSAKPLTSRQASKDDLQKSGLLKREKSKEEFSAKPLSSRQGSKDDIPKSALPKREKSKDEFSAKPLSSRQGSKDDVQKSGLPKREKSKDEFTAKPLSSRQGSKDDITKSALPKREKSKEEFSSKALPKREKSKEEVTPKSVYKTDFKGQQPIKSEVKKPEPSVKGLIRRESSREELSSKTGTKKKDSKEDISKLGTRKVVEVSPKPTPKKKEEVPKTPLAKRRDSKEDLSKSAVKRPGSSKDSDSRSSSIKSDSPSPKASDKLFKKDAQTIKVVESSKVMKKEISEKEFKKPTGKEKSEPQLFSGTSIKDPTDALKLVDDTSALKKADLFTVDQGSLIHDSNTKSISEDLIHGESSSIHSSSSQAIKFEKDITISSSSMSEFEDIEAKRHNTSTSNIKSTIEDIKSGSKTTPEGKFISELSGARVLEILEPDAENQSRQDSMDVSSIEIDEVKFSAGTQDSSEKAMDSLDTLGPDVSFSSATFSEETPVDYSVSRDSLKQKDTGLQPITIKRKTERDSFDLESPPMISPRSKVKMDLEIKPVDWMIGDKKIEVKEPLEPSQAFDRELEEYQSSLQKQNLKSDVDTMGKKKFDIPRIEETSSISFDDPELVEISANRSKFTVIPVSERDLEVDKDLVENKLDVSCQELIDTLQREYDAKTPTDDRLEEIAARSFHFTTIDDDDDSFDFDKEKLDPESQKKKFESHRGSLKISDWPLETRTAINVIEGQQFMSLDEPLKQIEISTKEKDSELLKLYDEHFKETATSKDEPLDTSKQPTKQSNVTSMNLIEMKSEKTLVPADKVSKTKEEIGKELDLLDYSDLTQVSLVEKGLSKETVDKKEIVEKDSSEKKEKGSYDLGNYEQPPDRSEMLLKMDASKNDENEKKDDVQLLSFKTFDPEDAKKIDETKTVPASPRSVRTEHHRESKTDMRSKGWDDHKKREKSHSLHSETSPYKVKKEDLQNVDLSSKFAITVLDQVVKKEIAEVKENLQAAKQDLIEELSENSEKVIQIEDSPSEFQFKLQPESIPNELPFLYKPPSLDEKASDNEMSSSSSPIAKPRRQSEVGKDEISSDSSSERKTSDKDSSKVTNTVIEADSKSVQKDILESISTSPKAASRSGSTEAEVSTDGFSLQPPQPAPRRRPKPTSQDRRSQVTSESEADVSSSTESNYQSCYSSGSRPLSSDVEALQSGAQVLSSSEYETAMMSLSSKGTSQDYYTAASTLSSKESMKSISSDISSGQFGSIERDSGSEMSETLMASEADLEKDEIDENLELALDKTSNAGSDDEDKMPFDSDVPGLMKRSGEMIFNQVISQESSSEGKSSQAKQSSSSTLTSGEGQTSEYVTAKQDKSSSSSSTSQVISKRSDTLDDPSTSSSDRLDTKGESVYSFEPDSLECKYVPTTMAATAIVGEDEGTPGSGLTLQQQLSMTSSSMSGVSLETVIEKGQNDDKNSDSDSFELVDKPDIIDDFVVVEEVGREAEEYDSEGKGVRISSISCTSSKNYDRDVENLIADKPDAQKAQAHSTKSVDLFDFESEESPPQASGEGYSDEEQYSEGGKKWIEMQFQQNETRLYDIEYERGPLEDIKEEEVADFEAGSSRIGSLGSQKESVGSMGSMKGSFGSTPDNYDNLTAKRFFKPTDHDNVSLSSLQEFEHLENIVALENAKKRSSGSDQHSGSQDSSSNGSLPRRYKESRSDEQSVSSVKDFEVLETACKEAHLIELRAREEEDLLDHESPENRFKLENLAKAKLEAQGSAAGSFNPSTSGSDDYEKRIKEIDDIIKMAQQNIEKRHDEDAPLPTEQQKPVTVVASAVKTEKPSVAPPTEAVKGPSEVNLMETSTDSLEGGGGQNYNLMYRSSDSLELQKALVPPSVSSDSLNNVRDSKEEHDRQASGRRISSDSLEFSNQDSDTSKGDDKPKTSSTGKS